ncbi:hypothetical protein EG329_010912 [Mollisiaceae sp. DMI_Dod_QoI]|nr:hypothetical protein EG329_010912 [Helotiales sp. DMI_Dod_QoI]
MANPSIAQVQPDTTQEPDQPTTDVSLIGSTLLCSNCQSLFSTSKTFEELKSKPGLRFTKGRRNTLRNAVDGCRLCRELLCIPYNSVSEYWERWERERGLKGDSAEMIRGWPVEVWRSELALLEPQGPKERRGASDRNMLFSLKGDVQFGYNVTLSKHRRLWFAKKMDFEIAAYKDDPAVQDIRGKVRNRSVDCDATYNEIRDAFQGKWRRKHRPVFTPSFLIDVQDKDGTVRLRPTKSNEYPPYVALSFAWGATQLMTTKSNFDAHLDNIKFETLSQTIQDAILVTRKLRQRYLWVDALCMIQDSEEDKLEQTAALRKIFENSWVSIIANCAKTCDDGFLQETVLRNRFEIPYRAKDGTDGKVSLTAVEPRVPGTTKVEPLQTRAWAYQEFCLSKRAILYDKNRIDWRFEKDSILRPTSAIRAWTKHVRQFSGKELSDPREKISAISGLAEHYSIQMPYSKYLAGIFSAETHHQLCWYATAGKRLSRPQTWRAPSWSPFAVDGPVELWHNYSSTAKVEPFLVNNAGEYHAHFEILDCAVELFSEKAPFGRLIGGFIQVEGYLMRIRKDVLLSLSSIGNILGGLGVVMESESRKPGRVGMMYFDTVNSFGTRIASADSIQTNHGPLRENVSLACLATCKKKTVTSSTDDRSNRTTYTTHYWDAGLVLARLENGDYHRVGHFICNKKNIFPGSLELEVVRIV